MFNLLTIFYTLYLCISFIFGLIRMLIWIRLFNLFCPCFPFAPWLFNFFNIHTSVQFPTIQLVPDVVQIQLSRLYQIVMGNIGLHLNVRIPTGVGHFQAVLALTVVSTGQSCHHYLTQQSAFFLLRFAYSGILLSLCYRTFGFFLNGIDFYFFIIFLRGFFLQQATQFPRFLLCFGIDEFCLVIF